MKITPLQLLLVGLLAQGSRGDLLEMAKQEAVGAVGELTEAVTRGRELLKLVATATKLHREAEAKASMTTVDNQGHNVAMNYEACSNLSKSLVAAQALAFDLAQEGYATVSEVTQAVNQLLACPSLNPIKAVTCMLDDIKVIKTDMDSIRPFLVNAKNKIEEMYVQVHGELLDCVGFEHIIHF